MKAFLIDAITKKTLMKVDVPSVEYLDPIPYGENREFVVFDENLGNIEDFETAKDGDKIAIVPRTIDPVAALAVAKIEKREIVKATRDKIERNGCVTPHGIVDTDERSQGRLARAVTTATIKSASFTKTWRMRDNTTKTLNANQMKEVWLAVDEHIDACQQAKNALDAKIKAATTLDELNAINLDSGWPEIVR